MKPIYALATLLLCSPSHGVEAPPTQGGADSVMRGIAANYPGDTGLEKHPSVVFLEDFESGDVDSLKKRWDAVGNRENALEIVNEFPLEMSPGTHALRITARNGKNEGGLLNKIFKPGYDTLFVRMYVRFDAAYGCCHHFCKLGGDIDPLPGGRGRAGQRAETWFKTGIEPTTGYTHTWPPENFPPPGAWYFYSYWPEMHSWQSDDGSSKGQPNAYYGNRFQPGKPVLIERGRWICVEWSITLNTAADRRDGSERFWIDGRLAGAWGPGTPIGYWMKEQFRIRPDQPEKAKPFEGFRWRQDMAIRINEFKIENYVSAESFSASAAYKTEHPDFPIDTEKAVVWFDHIVVATEYIGPMATGRK